MASFVLLLKEIEDEEKVIYKFGPNEIKMRLLKLKEIKSKGVTIVNSLDELKEALK